MRSFARALSIGLLTLTALGFTFSQGKGAEAREVLITAWTVGPDDPSITRAQNLEAAGHRLNKILADVGSDIRVKVETEFNTEDWGSFSWTI